jgi:hypothetical protein
MNTIHDDTGAVPLPLDVSVSRILYSRMVGQIRHEDAVRQIVALATAERPPHAVHGEDEPGTGLPTSAVPDGGNRARIREAIAGLPSGGLDEYLILSLRYVEHSFVDAFVDLVGRARAEVPGGPLYTDRLRLHADDVDVPANGPRWQILDAGDETTWHDVGAVAKCEDADCPVAVLDLVGDEVECIVLVSAVWEDGEAHMPADTMVDVRIPAVSR